MTLDDDSAILTLPPSPPESLAPGNHRSKQHHYALTSSERASSMGGTVRPSVLAVWALMTSSNLLDCTTGNSAGLARL